MKGMDALARAVDSLRRDNMEVKARMDALSCPPHAPVVPSISIVNQNSTITPRPIVDLGSFAAATPPIGGNLFHPNSGMAAGGSCLNNIGSGLLMGISNPVE
ncbi:hypothetical protein RND81_09G063000 [Saponaria officinalis]|uniref:Uncharacterized protein n=1 Tax=Saponaria officinalis TaxID=3572 RepID=A0AAW1IJH0_SAPOF